MALRSLTTFTLSDDVDADHAIGELNRLLAHSQAPDLISARFDSEPEDSAIALSMRLDGNSWSRAHEATQEIIAEVLGQLDATGDALAASLHHRDHVVVAG